MVFGFRPYILQQLAVVLGKGHEQKNLSDGNCTIVRIVQRTPGLLLDLKGRYYVR
jgi:hypothetical protein